MNRYLNLSLRIVLGLCHAVWLVGCEKTVTPEKTKLIQELEQNNPGWNPKNISIGINRENKQIGVVIVSGNNLTNLSPLKTLPLRSLTIDNNRIEKFGLSGFGNHSFQFDPVVVDE